MDSKDVEEIFKGVLTEESQSTHEPVISDVGNNPMGPSKYALNTSSAVIANQQQDVIIHQGPPPIMSPSHSGNAPWARNTPLLSNICVTINFIFMLLVIQNNMNIAPVRNVPSVQTQAMPTQQQSIPSPATYPAASPYHSEYST